MNPVPAGWRRVTGSRHYDPTGDRARLTVGADVMVYISSMGEQGQWIGATVTGLKGDPLDSSSERTVILTANGGQCFGSFRTLDFFGTDCWVPED